MKKEKKKLSISAIVLIVGLIIIAVPCLVFGYILISSALQTSKPVIGSRFDNDLEPSITKSQISEVETQIKALSNVDDCEVVLTTAQFRVNVDASDAITTEEAAALSEKVYQIIDGILPIDTYFTLTDQKKMYDLAINVYNYINKDDDLMIYYLVTKNSNMEEKTIQLVSEPLDDALAKELRGEVVEDDPEQGVIVDMNEADNGEEE